MALAIPQNRSLVGWLLRHFFASLGVCLLVSSAVIESPDAFAAPPKPKKRTAAVKDTGYEGLRKSLAALREKDPTIVRIADWENLSGKFRQYVEGGGPNTPGALFNLGRIYEAIFLHRDFQAARSRAAVAYERLIREFPKHALADDAQKSLQSLQRDRSRVPDSIDESDLIFQNSGNIRAVPTIVIDPGHGGDDLGAEGKEGVLEKQVVLNIARRLSKIATDRLRAKIILTRTEDRVVPLDDRTKVANDANAKLFVSIHANASPKKNAFGIETYYLDTTDEQSSLKLAERENASIRFGGDDLGFMLSDLIQNVKLDESISLAHHIQDSLVRTTSVKYKDTKSLGVKRAPFFVLVGAHMPCVLVEVAFIDHPVEGARLATSEYQELVAQGIYRGLRAFFGHEMAQQKAGLKQPEKGSAKASGKRSSNLAGRRSSASAPKR